MILQDNVISIAPKNKSSSIRLFFFIFKFFCINIIVNYVNLFAVIFFACYVFVKIINGTLIFNSLFIVFIYFEFFYPIILSFEEYFHAVTAIKINALSDVGLKTIKIFNKKGKSILFLKASVIFKKNVFSPDEKILILTSGPLLTILVMILLIIVMSLFLEIIKKRYVPVYVLLFSVPLISMIPFYIPLIGKTDLFQVKMICKNNSCKFSNLLGSLFKLYFLPVRKKGGTNEG